jgi:hypothetical protein
MCPNVVYTITYERKRLACRQIKYGSLIVAILAQKEVCGLILPSLIWREIPWQGLLDDLPLRIAFSNFLKVFRMHAIGVAV